MIQIEKQIRTIEPEIFEPTSIIIRVISSTDTTAFIWVQLTQTYTGDNPGTTVRQRNFTVPKVMIDSLQLDWQGNAGNPQAMAYVLAQFNLVEYVEPTPPEPTTDPEPTPENP